MPLVVELRMLWHSKALMIFQHNYLYCNSPSRISCYLEVYQVDMVTLEDKSEAKELMA